MLSNNYLVHHGVKGQKWGVRLYQNPDGSLTSQGRMRYRIEASPNRPNGWYTAKPMDVEIRRYKPKNKSIEDAGMRYKALEKEINSEMERKKAEGYDEYDRNEWKSAFLLNELEKNINTKYSLFSYNGSEYFNGPEDIQRTIRGIYELQELEAKGRLNKKLRSKVKE